MKQADSLKIGGYWLNKEDWDYATGKHTYCPKCDKWVKKCKCNIDETNSIDENTSEYNSIEIEELGYNYNKNLN